MIEKSKYISAPVTESGIEGIQIGMSLKDFAKLALPRNSNLISESLQIESAYPCLLIYKFFGFLIVYVDAIDSTVYRILLRPPFRGRYLDRIAIGTDIGGIENLDEFRMDDDYLIHKNTGVVFVVDEDLMILDDNYSGVKIESIEIRGSE